MRRNHLVGCAVGTFAVVLSSACEPDEPTHSETAPTEPPKHHEYMVPAAEASTIRERLKANGYTEYYEASICEGMTTFIVPYTSGNELIGIMGALGQYSNLGDGPVRIIGETEEQNQCP